jgi:hypothetical protein
VDLTYWNVDLQIPWVQQEYSNDCGVFTIQNAYSLYNQTSNEFTTDQLRKSYAEALREKGVLVNLHKRHAPAHPDSPSPKIFKHDGISNNDQTTPDNSGGMIPISALSYDVESETFVCLDRSSPNFEFQGMGSFQGTSPTPFVFGVDDDCVL